MVILQFGFVTIGLAVQLVYQLIDCAALSTASGYWRDLVVWL